MSKKFNKNFNQGIDISFWLEYNDAAEVKVAEMYLENYRRKAEIRSTFGTDESLIEFEKDRAQEQYKADMAEYRKQMERYKANLSAKDGN